MRGNDDSGKDCTFSMILDEMILEPLFWDGKTEKPVTPKQLEIRKITATLAVKLNKAWHSRLPKIPHSNITRNRYSVCYGFHYSGLYIGCAVWTSPVNQNFDINTTLELRRLALSQYCPPNTATYVISKMVSDIKNRFVLVTDLISYQDTEVHTGTIYKAANWFIDGETKFNTWSRTNGRKRNANQSQANKIRWKYIIKRTQRKPLT